MTTEMRPITVKLVTENGGVALGTSDDPVAVSASIDAQEIALDVSQLGLFTAFNDILKELKKLNFQMTIMTDNCVDNSDVEI